MGYTIGHRELTLQPLLKSLFAEALGTAILVLVGCGSALNWKTDFDVTQVLYYIMYLPSLYPSYARCLLPLA